MQGQDTHLPPRRRPWIVGPAGIFNNDVESLGFFEGKLWAAMSDGVRRIDGVPNLLFGELKHLVQEMEIEEVYPIAHVFGMMTNATYACRCAGLIEPSQQLDYKTADQRTAYNLFMFGEHKEEMNWVQDIINDFDMITLRLPGQVADSEFLPFIEQVKKQYRNSTAWDAIQALAQRRTTETEALANEQLTSMGTMMRSVAGDLPAKSTRSSTTDVPPSANGAVTLSPVAKLRWQKPTVDLALVLHALYTTGCIPATSERQLWEAAAQHFDFDTTAKDPAEALRQAYQQVRKGDAGKKTLDSNRLGEFIRECREAIPILSAIIGAIDSDSQQDTAP